MNWTQLVRLAKTVSLAQSGRCRHVAFIYRGNKLLAVGINSSKTHPLAKGLKKQKQSETQCAELNASLKLGCGHRDDATSFRELTLAVIRIKQNGETGMSKPCSGCQHLIRQLGFKRVVYSGVQGERLQW